MEDFKVVLNNLEKFKSEGLPKIIEKGLTNACLMIEGEAVKKAHPGTDNFGNQSPTQLIWRPTQATLALTWNMLHM